MVYLKPGNCLLSGLLAIALHVSPVAAQEKNLTIFLSPALLRVADEVAPDFSSKGSKAEIISNDTSRLIKAFCDAPNDDQKVLVISRKLSQSEMQRCEKDQGTLMGIQLARYLLGAASNSPALNFDVKPKTIYLAVASDVPRSAVADSNLPSRKRSELLSETSDDFIHNPFRTWRDIDANLPDVEIQVLLPDGGSAKGIVAGRLLEHGCRRFKEPQRIFSAEVRVRACTQYRDDKHVTLTEGALFKTALKDLLSQDKPTLGFLRHEDLRNEGVKALTMQGIDPLDPNFDAKIFTTRASLSVYFFESTVFGQGPSKSATPTATFLTDLLSEQIVGPDGALVKAGFYPNNRRERESARGFLRTVRGLGSIGVN